MHADRTAAAARAKAAQPDTLRADNKPGQTIAAVSPLPSAHRPKWIWISSAVYDVMKEKKRREIAGQGGGRRRRGGGEREGQVQQRKRVRRDVEQKVRVRRVEDEVGMEQDPLQEAEGKRKAGPIVLSELDPSDTRTLSLRGALEPLFRTLRPSHRSLLATLISLREEYALLTQLWYKGSSQFRSARWWRAMDAPRRVLRRMLGKMAAAGADGKMKEVEEDQNAGLKNEAISHQTLADLGHVWNALWGEETAAVGPVALDGVPLPKPKRPATHAPSLRALTRANRSVHGLERLAQALCERTKAAWSVLTAHLRTPPAPTFAPQIITLVSLCARLHALGSQLIRGNFQPVAQLATIASGVSTPAHAHAAFSAAQSLLPIPSSAIASLRQPMRGNGNALDDDIGLPVRSASGNGSFPRSATASAINSPIPSRGGTPKPDQTQERNKPGTRGLLELCHHLDDCLRALGAFQRVRLGAQGHDVEAANTKKRGPRQSEMVMDAQGMESGGRRRRRGPHNRARRRIP